MGAQAAGVMNTAQPLNRGITMREATKRSIFRWIHIVCGIPIIGYIYDSPKDTPYYASTIRYIFLPALVLVGLWMWKGHVVRRLIWKRPAQPGAGLAGVR